MLHSNKGNYITYIKLSKKFLAKKDLFSEQIFFESDSQNKNYQYFLTTGCLSTNMQKVLAYYENRALSRTILMGSI